jgi:hypothetical protein
MEPHYVHWVRFYVRGHANDNGRVNSAFSVVLEDLRDAAPCIFNPSRRKFSRALIDLFANCCETAISQQRYRVNTDLSPFSNYTIYRRPTQNFDTGKWNSCPGVLRPYGPS